MLQTHALVRTTKSFKNAVRKFFIFVFTFSLLTFNSQLSNSFVFAADLNISTDISKSFANNQSNTVNATINSPNSYTDSIIDFEIYNDQGQKVFQQFFEHQNIVSSQNLNLSINWTPSNLGNYVLKIGIFNNNWSQNYFWQDKVSAIQVVNQSSTIVSTQDFTLSLDTTASPNFKLSVNSPKNISDIIIDFEIYNDQGQKVFQQFFEHQNLIANSASDYQISWEPSGSTKYQAKAGVFNNNWSQNYYWNDNIQSLSTNTPTQSLEINKSENLSNTTYTVGTDGKIYKNGQKISLNGVSWFGAEGGAHVPHGLWTRNWREMISQMKNVGFNAVRLPYCPATVQNVDVSTIEYTLNQDLTGLKSLDVLDKIINEMNRQQLYILLDNHNPDCQAQSDLWYTGSYSEAQWINDLAFLADRYKNLDYFIGLDIKNEPRGSATWGTGNSATDWNTAAEKAGKEILSKNFNLLIFIQGIENNSTCSDNSFGHWWGGNLEPQKCTPIKNEFIPQNKQVFTPHVYGPDVFNQGYFNTSEFPQNLNHIWDTNFGFLKNNGKAVVLGEFGGKYGHGGDSKDVVWQNALVNYMISKGMTDSFYWSWNPNSGDTGGILKDDWTSVWQDKIDLLNKLK